MSNEKIYQCKYCGTRILRKQTVPENAAPCPSCGRHDWAEIRSFGGTGAGARTREWMRDLFQAIESGDGEVRWR